MNTIGIVQTSGEVGQGSLQKTGIRSVEPRFKDKLSQVLSDINRIQLESAEMAEKFVSGEIKDVHDVMIAAEKASVSLELTIEVRNKLVAYREIMRTQI